MNKYNNLASSSPKIFSQILSSLLIILLVNPLVAFANINVDSSCDNLGPYGERTSTSAIINITNNTSQNLQIRWLQEDGTLYSNIYDDSFMAGETWSKSAYVGDKWVVTDENQNCVKLIVADINGSYDVVGDSATGGAILGCSSGITTYPSTWENSRYYKRLCTSGTGLLIVSGSVASAASIEHTAYTIDGVMQTVDSRVAPKMVQNGFRHAVMGSYPNELTTMLPEYSHLPADPWDERARGLGGMPSVPLGSGAEENVMCYSDDRYLGEDITIHEFAHSLHLLGLDYIFPNFSQDLQAAYSNAKYYKIWGNGHYALTDYKEYWAEGVQSYFNANMGGGPNIRSALQTQDLMLYNLIYSVFGNNSFYSSCPK